MKKIFKKIFFIFLSLIILCVASFLIYASIYYKAEDVSDYVESDSYVTVTETKDYISFMPSSGNATVGFVFYPGAKVDEKAYSEMMYDLARLNIFAAIVKMPLRFAFFNPNGANKVLAYYEDVKYWYIGGHSLGGVMATDYLYKNQDKYQGFILLGSYVNKDYSNSDLWGMTIYGSNDKVLKRSSYDNAQSKMPKHNYEYVIEGGNHANFASYGKQNFDGEATIDREKQIDLTVLKIIEFIGLKQLTLLI